MDTIETPRDTIETSNATTPFKSRQVVHMALQLLALALLIIFCFNVLSPFINPVVWGAILAIALYPLHQRLKRVLRGRSVLAAILVAIIMLATLILPAVWLTITTGAEVKDLVTDYRSGNISIPPPTEKVKDWP